MQAWEQELRRELPANADVFDAHVHLGTDIDGFRGDYEELERIQGRFGISRAFMFCLDEPDRHRSEERRVGKECRSRWSPYH